MKNILLSLLLLFAGSAYAGKIEKIEGQIANDGGSISLTISVVGIAINQKKDNPETADFQSMLAIFFPDFSLSPAPILSARGDSTSSTVNAFYYWELTGGNPSLLTKDNQTFTMTYKVTVFPNPDKRPTTTTIKDLAVNGIINVNARFVPLKEDKTDYESPDSNIARDSQLPTAQALTQIFSSPSKAPTSFSITPSFKSLKLSWSTESMDFVPTTNPAIKQTPGNVLVMVFKANSGTTPLVAYNADATSNYQKVTCNFLGRSGDDCISCSPVDDDSSIKDPPGAWVDLSSQGGNIQSFTIVSNSGSTTVGNLEKDGNYIVALQYEKGVKRTSCLEGTPTVDYTATELNDPDLESKPGDPRCFIVSAAFGSPFNKHVDIFRWARDRFLEPSSVGHEFVEFYYEHSQPFANLVRNSPVLQILVRTILYPIAFLLYGLQESIEYPILSFSLAALLFAFILMRLLRRNLGRS